MKRGTTTALALIGLAVPAQAEAACTKYAAPTGSDSNPGSLASPYRTAQKLVNSLAAGQTGCLQPGTYVQDLQISHAGTTLTSADPANRATVKGRFWIAKGADHTTVTQVRIDGRSPSGLPSPTVNAKYATFTYDDVTNHNDTNHHGEIAFDLGSTTWGVADYFVANHDVVHDVGEMSTAKNTGLEPGGFFEHAFYVADSQHWLIQNTLIYHVSGRGIQIYPHAQNGTARNNTIDGAGTGVIIDGNSSGNLITRNIVTRSFFLGGVVRGSSFSGSGNQVTDNYFSGNVQNYSGVPSSGISLGTTKTGSLPYVDPATYNFKLKSGSAATGYGPDWLQP